MFTKFLFCWYVSAKVWQCSLHWLYNVFDDCYRHLSCEEDRQDVARFLVEHGARLDTLNKSCKTPLDYANITLTRILSEMNK